MKKYVGELGYLLPSLTIIHDTGNLDQDILLKSIYRVFNPFINLEFIGVGELLNRKNQRFLKNQSEIVITTSVTSLRIINNEPMFNSKNLIGFFNFSEKEMQDCQKIDLSKLDRVVVVNERSFNFISKFIDKGKVRRTEIALDLRRFYGLKKTSVPSEFVRVGILVEENDLEDSKLTAQVSRCLTQNQKNTQIIIQPKKLADQSYSHLKTQIPESFRHQVAILDPQYSLHQQIEFFKSIDILVWRSDSLEQDVLLIEAQAAGIGVLQDKSLAESNEASDNGTNSHKISKNDFRILKFDYIRNFFGDGIQAKQLRQAVVIPADAGFFSVFNTLVSVRAHWTGIHGFSDIHPDWSVSSVLKFWKTNRLTSYCYASSEEGNVYFTLFENPSVKEALGSQILNSSASRKSIPREYQLHSPNLFADPDFTYVYADRLYRSAGFQNWREEMHKSLKGLKPNVGLVGRIDELFKVVSSDDLVIGMHVRHPSHAMEQPNSEIPIAVDYIRVARELLANSIDKYDKIFVFLATDQDSVVEEFRLEFGQQLLVFCDVTRVTSQETKKYESLNDKQKLEIGSQVQHIAAMDPQKWSSKLAEEIIVDAWALSRCNVLLHAVSNVATAVLFINPELESLPLRRNDTLSSIKLRKYLSEISSVI